MSKIAKTPPSDKEIFETDVRFLLANERTLLAWIRTGLTLQAGGFAFAHFNSDSIAAAAGGIAAIICGGVMAIVGYNRYRSADKAIRNNELPNKGAGPTVEVISIVTIAIILAIILILSLAK